MQHLLITWTDLISKSWKTYRENFNSFVQPVVISILISILQLLYVFHVVPNYLPEAMENFSFTLFPILITLGWVVISIFLWVINLWLVIVFLKISDSVIAGKKLDFPLIYQQSFTKLPRFFLISVVYGLIVMGGMILLIVPGVFWAIRYFFAPMHTALSEQKQYVEQSLKFSKESTIGRWWPVAARLVLPQVFFNIILIIITYGFAALVTGGQYQSEQLSGNFYFNLLIVVMNGLFIPLMTLPVVLLYRDIAHHKTV